MPISPQKGTEIYIFIKDCCSQKQQKGNIMAESAKTPADFLNSIKGKPVIVKLNSGVDYKGTYRINEFINMDSLENIIRNRLTSYSD